MNRTLVGIVIAAAAAGSIAGAAPAAANDSINVITVRQANDHPLAVRCIQQALGVRPRDGQYGQATYDAVRRFQRANDIQVDGDIGRQTGQLILNRIHQRIGRATYLRCWPYIPSER